MKKKQWAQSFSLIDEKYVEEADPMRDAGRVSAVRRLRRRIITLAACAAAVLLGLILFIPYRAEVPDVSRYADSEYYAVIQRLNDGQVIKPRYRNNLDYLLSKTLSKTDGDMNFATGGTGTAKDGGTRPETGAYRETTDNQVAGIVEGDLLKRTDTRIYYADVDSAMLRVYSVMGEDSALLGSFDLTQVTVYPYEMYLSADGRSVTLLCNGGNNHDTASGCDGSRRHPGHEAGIAERNTGDVPADRERADAAGGDFLACRQEAGLQRPAELCSRHKPG